jgi:hypothetical protein
LFFREKAAAEADIAGQGQFWVRNDTPNVPMFTDGAGNDRALCCVESGTFTPLLTDDSLSDEGATYAIQSGRYRRIGDVVHIWIDIEVTTFGSLTTSQAARIIGLPFTPAGYGAVVAFRGESLALGSDYSVSGAATATSPSSIFLYKWNATTGPSSLTLAQLSADGELNLYGTYIAA